MSSLTVADLRIIFDEEEKQMVIGCHYCEETDGKPLHDIVGISRMIPEFAVSHIKSCGTKASK